MTAINPILLVLGMPGSGKTTVGNMLSQLLDAPHRSVGDVLRAGRNSGKRIPVGKDPATWFLEQELQRIMEKPARGVILDFSPVTHDGAGQLTMMLHEQGCAVHRVVYVKTTMKIAEARYRFRGQRLGDVSEDGKTLFAQRIAKEFWPFTVPMVRDASKRGYLLTLKNSADQTALTERVVHLVSTIRTTWLT